MNREVSPAIPGEAAIGYCTNVHPGTSLEEVLTNLREHAAAVRCLVSPQGSMSCGLWLSRSAVAGLLADSRARGRLRKTLADAALSVSSLNGFPAGDFHQAVVKHSVYLPDWADPLRLEYTCHLAELLAQLLDSGESGSISTLPLGWGKHQAPEFAAAAARQLREWAHFADRLQDRTGRRIRLAIEPEPGCFMDTAHGLCDFFVRYLLDGSDGANTALLNRIGVCHDVCHSAVMFEPQAVALQEYQRHGIPIWKVQVSSALEVRFAEPGASTERLIRQLGTFAEPRFLHQTGTGPGRLYEDLPVALDQAERSGVWRIHFHVPVFVDRFAPGLGTTQAAIGECLRALPPCEDRDIEIETYAWNVLPEEFQPASLVEGIAAEVNWLRDEMRNLS